VSWQTATDWKTRECMKFAGETYGMMPPTSRISITKDYLKNYKRDYKAANLSFVRLRKIIESEQLADHPLTAYFDEERLQEISEFKALTVKQLACPSYILADKVVSVTDYIESVGIEIPEQLKKDDHGLILRAMDTDWWRRQLRKVSSRYAEKIALHYGLVCKNKSIYCSDIAVQRYRAMKKRNRAMMEGTVIENEVGFALSLQEISDRTVANPAIRRAELMTRIRGFDDYAKHTGKAAVFITVTAPSRYHTKSDKWTGETPKDTQCYLNGVWSRIRAQLARENIEIFGFRVAEPHHDGTPHAHFLLFVKPKLQRRLVQIFNQYALQEDGDERGAKKVRCQVIFIDRKTGSAVSYISKYISKNIDGFGVENDLYGFDAASSAERITAWASLWGIRQFQQIGGIPVTVWRTLRRIETEFDDEDSEAARKYADSGEWDMFTRYCQKAKFDLLKEQPQETNKYGEECPPKVVGVFSQVTGEIGLATTHVWELREQPWTRVNNCTEPKNLLEKIDLSTEPIH